MEDQNLEVPQQNAGWPAPRSRPRAEPAPKRPTESTTALAEMAHDLRGLLTVVKGYAELLLEETGRQASPSGEIFCNKILRSCAVMENIIENCLDLNRIQSGRLAVRPQRLDLPSFLEETVSCLSLRARAKEITLVVDVARPLPSVHTDVALLQRVLGNLLDNAIKFSPPKATVQVVARPVGAWVELEVTDEGPGIEATEVPELFEAYRRGSARPTGGEKSTGLGLAIVKELVAALGGSICVRSRPGAGATFSVAFPVG